MQRNFYICKDEKMYGYGYNEVYANITGLQTYKNIDALDNNGFYAYTANFIETDNLLKLIINGINFDEKTLTFSEKEFLSFEFSKDTKEGKVSDIPENIWEKEYYKNVIDIDLLPESLTDIAVYISKVITYNENVQDYYSSHSVLINELRQVNSVIKFIYPSYGLINTLRFITENLIEIEKLITSDNEAFLINLLNSPNSKLEKGKKLHQVISIPAFAMNFIKENDLMDAKEDIRKIASEFDGNTLKILFDMFESFVPYEKYDSKRVTYYNNPVTKKKTFINNIYTLLQKGYKISDLLNYLLKQRMYWSEENFGFPYEEAKTLIDYINICDKYSLNFEKYPQSLKKYHDIVIKNIEVLKSDNEKKEKFENAVKTYFSKDIEIGNYIFTAPSNIESLVSEGDNLHHCIGNYSNAIIDGISRIYFMREKKDPKKSFVTLELNKDNDLVEFKGDYNKEPTDTEVKTAINNFVKKVKKGGI